MAVGRLNRGDVWLVTLDPTVGSEIRKTRPCLIVSPPEIHNNIRTVIIAPLTSGSTQAPGRVPADFMGVQGFIMLEHIRGVDRARLIKRLGTIDDDTLRRSLTTLQKMFSE